MAGVQIDISVTGRGQIDLLGELGDQLDDDGELVVVHEPGACAPCRGNDDIHQVPFSGCIGNVAGHHPESAHAQAIGNLCKCTVRFVHDRDREPDF